MFRIATPSAWRWHRVCLPDGMDLERYRRPRMVVQHPHTPVRDTARAMDSNRVGFVMVQDHGRLVGVVTDRDLALRVVAAGLDPSAIVLEDVMTLEPSALSIDATTEQVLELMRARRIRRVPLLERHHIVGLVSIDDIVIAATADPQLISDVILAQLAEPAELKPAGAVHPTKPATARRSDESKRSRRGTARMLQTAHEAARKVQEETGLEDKETALTAVEVVVADIMRRLTPPEAHDLLAQLPKELQRRLTNVPEGPDENLTRETIELDLVRRLKIEPGDAPKLLNRLGVALERLVSRGEIADVKAQLPRGMKGIFP